MDKASELNVEQRLLRKLWLKGFTQSRNGEGQGVVLTFATSKERERIRLKFYNAVRLIRNGQEQGVSQELIEAVNNSQITCYLDEAGKYALRIQAITADSSLKSIAEQAGVNLAELLDEGAFQPGDELRELISGGE